MKTLVLAESSEAQKELCGGARSFSTEVFLASIGQTPEINIADKAFKIELPQGEIFENASESVIHLFKKLQPEIVFVESTPHLKIIGGLVAASAETSLISDVINFEDNQAESLYFGGLATIKRMAGSRCHVYSISGSIFNHPKTSGTDIIEKCRFIGSNKPIKLLATHKAPLEGADLSRSEIVVGVGRGLSAKKDLVLARSFAQAVHGELACSRPLAENEKWLPKNLYLGVSGRMISPKVYFAIGISGQMQHMIGVHNADIIIAINKDKNAPVFNQSDFGLVADLHEALPALIKELS